MNVVNFPVERTGPASPDTDRYELENNLLAYANFLDGAAGQTPYPLWMKAMAGETRRMVREMKRGG